MNIIQHNSGCILRQKAPRFTMLFPIRQNMKEKCEYSCFHLSKKHLTLYPFTLLPQYLPLQRKIYITPSYYLNDCKEDLKLYELLIDYLKYIIQYYILFNLIYLFICNIFICNHLYKFYGRTKFCCIIPWVFYLYFFCNRLIVFDAKNLAVMHFESN